MIVLPVSSGLCCPAGWRFCGARSKLGSSWALAAALSPSHTVLSEGTRGAEWGLLGDGPGWRWAPGQGSCVGEKKQDTMV